MKTTNTKKPLIIMLAVITLIALDVVYGILFFKIIN